MDLVGFEPTISVGDRPKAYTLDGAATGTGSVPAVKISNITGVLCLFIHDFHYTLCNTTEERRSHVCLWFV
jgi:hypothetical protein